MRKKILLATVALALAGFLWLALTVPPILHGANGFAAKWVCSNVFVGGRTLELATADLPPNPLVGWIEVTEPELGTVTTAAFGAFERSAVHREGFGCTLLPIGWSRGDLAPAPAQQDSGSISEAPRADPTQSDGAVPPAENSPPSMAWPPVPASVDVSAVEDALARAFVESVPEHPKNTRATVVLFEGALVAERYAEGFTEQSSLPGWSMTKSVLNALYGRAVLMGSLDMKASLPYEQWTDRRRLITYDHLMRMSSGLEFSEDYGDLRSDAVRMLFVEPDSGLVAAEKEAGAAPDEVWYYSSGTTNILSRSLRDLIGTENYWEFAERELFEPLGMTSALIEPDAAGVFVASSFGWATARDWARFGQFFLDDGVVRGERLLPEDWVAYSREPTPAAPRGSYGAHFWLNAGADAERRWPELPADLYLASGFSGQAVVIVPSRRAVIVRLGLSHAGSSWDQSEFLADVLNALPHPDDSPVTETTPSALPSGGVK